MFNFFFVMDENNVNFIICTYYVYFYNYCVFVLYIKLQSTEGKIELRITGKIIPRLHDYINSEEFSRLILQGGPKLKTYFKMTIDGEIYSRIEKATKCWIY